MLARLEAFGRVIVLAYGHQASNEDDDEDLVIDNSTSADLEPAPADDDYSEARTFGFAPQPRRPYT